MNLLAWVKARPAGHPARQAFEDACRHLRLFAVRPGPVAVAVADPRLWLSAWAAGTVIRWHEAGLMGLSAPEPEPKRAEIPPDPAPALIWAVEGVEGGERVYSHQALFEAIWETARVGAHGRGFSGPPGFVQHAAAWLRDLKFGSGALWWPDPAAPGWATDGARRVRYLPELLGAFSADEKGASTRIQDGRRLRSRRLHDGFWNGREVVPAAFPNGWYVLPYPLSEVS